jgi:hypothetical protein
MYKAVAEEVSIEERLRSHHQAPHAVFSDEQIDRLHKATEQMKQNISIHLIRETTNGKVASQLLKNMQDPLLRMNELSYNMVKGGGKFLQFAVNEQEKLQAEGWTIKGFTGLEVDRSTFEDLSGIVCYNPSLNVITVVYHGTANNAEGWETNFDAHKIEGKKVLKELQKDMYDETRKSLKAVSQKSNITELKKFLKDIESKDFGKENILQAQKMVEQLVAENKIETELGNHLLHQFRMKVDLIDYMEKTGVKVEGEIHKEFTKKYYSTKQEVLGLLKETLATMTPEQKKNVKIIFSGHSQAGETGNLALADITTNHGKELFGADFDNQKSGNFNGYFLSAARVGDKNYAKWIHQNVGRDFIARQNVAGDPVPIAAADEQVTQLFQKIPAAGKILAKAAGNYEDTGHLLYDDGHEAWTRAKEIYKEEGVLLRDFEDLDNAIHHLTRYIIDEEKIPQALVSNKTKHSSWNPFAKIQDWWNVYSMGRKIQNALSDENEKAQLEKLLNRRFSHFHYGLEIDAMGPVFSPAVVGRDLDKMLEYGRQQELSKAQKHVEAKKSAKTAIQDKFKKHLRAQ